MPENRKIIFSFDDGPASIGALNAILRVLQSNAIKAEFFVLGSEVKKYPTETRSIAIQGHKIQNHSWSHPNLAKASEEKVKSELARAPRSLPLSIHNWDIDTEDWKAPKGISSTKIEMIKKQFLLNKGKNTLNVLMPVQLETTRDLPDFIKYLKDTGCTFAAPLN